MHEYCFPNCEAIRSWCLRRKIELRIQLGYCLIRAKPEAGERKSGEITARGATRVGFKTGLLRKHSTKRVWSKAEAAASKWGPPAPPAGGCPQRSEAGV